MSKVTAAHAQRVSMLKSEENKRSDAKRSAKAKAETRARRATRAAKYGMGA